MQTVGQIIHNRRTSLGITLAELSRHVGVSRSYLSMIENQVVKPPSSRLLCALERSLELPAGQLTRTAAWQTAPAAIRDSVDQMAEVAQRGQELAKWLKRHLQVNRSLPTGKELVRRVNRTLRSPDRLADHLSLGTTPYCRVPLVNGATTDYPKGFDDLDYPRRVGGKHVSCPELADSTAFAAHVSGDSMLPEFKPGDIIIFSPAATVTSGCDCFVRIRPDFCTTFRRVYFDAERPTQVRLQPLNARYAPSMLEQSQVAGLHRAIWQIHKL